MRDVVPMVIVPMVKSVKIANPRREALPHIGRILGLVPMISDH